MYQKSFATAVGMVVVITAVTGYSLVQAQTPGNTPPPGYGPQIGPGSKGAVLKGSLPGTSFGTARPGVQQKTPTSAPPPGFHAQEMFNKPIPGVTPPPSQPETSKYEEGPDPNQDIAVTEDAGPWMILVMSYSGPTSPQMAREFVFHLKNHYELNAYVFNRGREKRLKELERVKQDIARKRAYYKKFNAPESMKIRVKYTRYEDQCAVLVGGYPSDAAANRELQRIRRLKPPNPERVKLDSKFYVEPKSRKKERVYINPFERAFVVRNPAIGVERPSKWDQPDIGFLRRLNRGEPFSLLNVKKPITLVVKVLQVPTIIQDERNSADNIFAKLGLGKKQQDTTAISAHNLAEVLRKAKLDAYVLHTKYSSIVTVGAYDSIDDPHLKAAQKIVATHFRLPPIQLLETPAPMQVPGVAAPTKGSRVQTSRN